MKEIKLKDVGLYFLHNHPVMEKELKVDEKYVIVDKIEWEFARQQLLKSENPINDIYASWLLDKQLEDTHSRTNKLEFIIVNGRKMLKS